MTLPVYAAVRLRSLPAGERLSATLRLGTGFGIGMLLLVPMALPYLAARRTGVIQPPRPALLALAAFLPRQLPGLHWMAPTRVVAPGLGGGGVVARLGAGWRGAPRAPRGGPAAAAWAMAAVAAALALGPYTEIGGTWVPTPYLLLYRWLPGFSAVRAPVRALIVCSAALSTLAGYALARAFAGRGAVLRWLVAGTLVAIVIATAAPGPPPVTRAHYGVYASPLYHTLA